MNWKVFLCSVLVTGSLMTASVQAEEAVLLDPQLLAPSSETIIPEGKFQKEKPWTIGFSWPGMGNTWIVQTIQEIKHEASHNPDVKELIFVEANWQTNKQVSDIEDLLARNVDALVILPINADLVKAQIAAARARNIPVIVYTSAGTNIDADVSIYGGGEFFGKVGGEFLKNKLNGKGTVWAFRGVAGSSDDTTRYNGFVKQLEGTEIKIGSEVFGEWNYAKSKQLCENLVATGQPVDGIWFSGAEMTRACIDVFNEVGKPLVPMTGEGNNGFLRIWKETGVDSMAVVFTPGIGPAMVRAATALLAGKQVHSAYASDPAPITADNFDKYYRPDLSDSFWMPSTLPEDVILETFKR